MLSHVDVSCCEGVLKAVINTMMLARSNFVQVQKKCSKSSPGVTMHAPISTQCAQEVTQSPQGNGDPHEMMNDL